MIKTTAIKYYWQSLFSLVSNFNWWVFPAIFFKKPLLIKIKNLPNFYVSNLLDIWTLKEVMIDRQYEQDQKLKKSKVIVDIGAAIGEFSLYSAQKSKKVIAYECDEERISLLKKNIQLNHAKNIVLKPIKAQSLKQILAGQTQIDFFKIDCEGGEYQIFQNASQAELRKIKYIAMEAHKFDRDMEKKYAILIKMLTKNNFSVKVIPNAVHDQICFVFAKKKSLLS